MTALLKSLSDHGVAEKDIGKEHGISFSVADPTPLFDQARRKAITVTYAIE